MPIIPENLSPIAPLLTHYLQPLLLWFSQLIYERLLARDPHHPLVVLDSLLDFTPLTTACHDYHHLTGRGRHVVHPTTKLLRAMLLKYWFDFSLRRLEQELRYNMLFRCFVGYGLHEASPDHTTLHRFEAYLYQQHPRLFFDTILKQIDATLDDGHARLQIGDTYALRANAALESLIQRLRHMAHTLLTTLHKEDPQLYAALYPQLDETALFGLPKEKRDFLLSRQEWQQRLLTTTQAVTTCLTRLDGQKHSAAVEKQRAYLTKTVADELQLTYDDQGGVIDVTLWKPTQRGTACSFSGADPEASIRNHGAHKKDPGYNISLATTLDFVREIRADTGSTSDVTPIPALLTAQMEHHAVCPDKLLYDQIAGQGKTVHSVEVATNGHTQLCAKPMPPKAGQTFGPEAFILSDDGFALTCPQGQRTCRRYRSGSGDGFIFRFNPPQCQGCARLMACRGAEQPPTTKRDVFISDFRPQYDRLVAYSQTQAFKQDMPLRLHVERIIAGLVLHNGARRAHFRGLTKVDFQVKMCATAYNLKHWLVRLDERAGRRQRPVRRTWGLAAPSQG